MGGRALAFYVVAQIAISKRGIELATTNYQTVDEYIAAFPSEVQVVLEELRRTIKEAAPQAQEKISYQMPTFTLNGNLVYFAAFKGHVGLYKTGGAIDAFRVELRPYAGEKGALRFPFAQPLPVALIRDVVKLRV